MTKTVCNAFIYGDKLLEVRNTPEVEDLFEKILETNDDLVLQIEATEKIPAEHLPYDIVSKLLKLIGQQVAANSELFTWDREKTLPFEQIMYSTIEDGQQIIYNFLFVIPTNEKLFNALITFSAAKAINRQNPSKELLTLLYLLPKLPPEILASKFRDTLTSTLKEHPAEAKDTLPVFSLKVSHAFIPSASLPARSESPSPMPMLAAARSLSSKTPSAEARPQFFVIIINGKALVEIPDIKCTSLEPLISGLCKQIYSNYVRKSAASLFSLEPTMFERLLSVLLQYYCEAFQINKDLFVLDLTRTGALFEKINLNKLDASRLEEIYCLYVSTKNLSLTETAKNLFDTLRKNLFLNPDNLPPKTNISAEIWHLLKNIQALPKGVLSCGFRESMEHHLFRDSLALYQLFEKSNLPRRSSITSSAFPQLRESMEEAEEAAKFAEHCQKILPKEAGPASEIEGSDPEAYFTGLQPRI